MKVVRIFETFYETDSTASAIEKFKAGSIYPLMDETQRQVDLQNGEILDASDDYVKAVAAADAAQASADKASDKADAAADAATLALAAAELTAAAAAADAPVVEVAA